MKRISCITQAGGTVSHSLLMQYTGLLHALTLVDPKCGTLTMKVVNFLNSHNLQEFSNRIKDQDI